MAAGLWCLAPVPHAQAVTVAWGPTGPPSKVCGATGCVVLTPQEIAAMLALAQTDISAALGSQKKVARGMADATGFASQAGTLQGYENYEWGALMVGGMVGIQVPGLQIPTSSYINEIGRTFENTRDVYAGGSASVAINLGLNAGRLGVRIFDHDIYFNAKYFALGRDFTISGVPISASVSTYGAGVALPVFNSWYLWKGFVAWRGLSIDLGLYYNKEHVVASIDKALPANISTYNLKLNSNAKVGFQTSVVTIPIDLVTSFQLLYLLNLSFGVGVDFNSGSGSVILNSPATVTYQGQTQGTLVVNGSTTGVAPDAVRTRVMVGLGLNLGPLKVDVPVTWYPASGFGVGASVGAVW